MFGQLSYVYLFFLLPVLVGILVYGYFQRKRRLKRFLHPDLWVTMVPGLSFIRRFWKSVLLCVAFLFLVVSLMRPQYGSRMETISRQGLDIMIGLDLSLSMASQDIKPNRFSYAKLEILNLINHLKGDRIGLMGFSGDAFVHCPLTVDYGAVHLFLDDFQLGSHTVPGTDLASAIKAARLSLRKSEGEKVLVLVTDGESFENDALASARVAAKEGVHIFTIGIGAALGEPIPLFDQEGRIQGYKKDAKNKVVLSKLNEPLLKEVSHLTHGRYYRYQPDRFVTDELYQYLSQWDKETFENQLTRQYVDRYHGFLLIVFLILLFDWVYSDRRKI